MNKKLEGTELLEYIFGVSRRMAEMRSLSPLLSYVIDEVLQLVNAKQGYIVLKDPAGDLDFKVARDQDGGDLTSCADNISHSILEAVISSGQSLVLSNAMADAHFGQMSSVKRLHVRSVMCVPLITKKHAIGAIYVENRSAQGRFHRTDLTPLELLANQAAVAIENASLNDDLEIVNQHLRELDELKTNFIVCISHELRTPPDDDDSPCRIDENGA